MKELFPLVDRYFACGEQTFWRWVEDASVIEWRHGPTIVFREELQCVLTALVPGGLPPLGSVLLLLAACRADWREQSDGPGVLCGMLGAEDQMPILEDVLRCLDLVSKSMPEAATGSAGKALLATLTFEKSGRRMGLEDSRRILQALVSGELDEALCQPSGQAQYSLLPDLKRLRVGLGSVSLAEFKDRARTGLDEPPHEPEVELPAPAPDLLSELAGDQETEGLARLVRRLIAAIRLPHRTGAPADDPGGGYSDIGSRGDLDKLLLSELAQDDLTLAVRVANNEALYLHRESPPAQPHQARVIFLDNTIRLWGVPRVLAMATALAIIHNTDGIPVVEVRQHGPDGFVPVDLTSKKTVMDALELLNPATTCAPAVRGAVVSASLPTDADCVFVTHPKTLEDHAFLAVERELDMPFSLIACVDREGAFCLYECTSAGRQLVSEAQFDVGEILGSTTKEREPALDGLPLFLREFPCPLLLPCDFSRHLCAYDPGKGVLGFDQRHRLVLYHRTNRGGRAVSLALSPTATRVFPCYPKDADGDYGVVLLENGVASFSTYRDGSLEPCLKGEIRVGDAIYGEIHGEQLALYRPDSAAAYSQADGKLVTRQRLPGSVCGSHAGVLCDNRRVVYDGTEFTLGEPLPPGELDPGSVVRGTRKCPYPPFKSLAAILLHPEHGLAVETKRQKCKLLDLAKLCFRHEGKMLRARGFKRFGFAEGHHLEGAGCTLRAARIADRGTVFVDDRGLLHLVSEEAGLPEITLTLTIDRPFGAWASDGSVTGPDYFLPEGVQATPPETFARTLQHVIDSLMP